MHAVQVQPHLLADLVALGLDEKDLTKRIGGLMSPGVEDMRQTWMDVGVVLQNDLFQSCRRRLEALELPPSQAERVQNLIMESMMENLHAD